MQSLRRFLLCVGVSVLRGASAIQLVTCENERVRVRRQESEYKVQNGNRNDREKRILLLLLLDSVSCIPTNVAYWWDVSS